MNGFEPKSTGELQLYKVLQRANLLSYYDIFISQGGDDVQQLCEAGEEEFLEIMSLVGMASKPLHVRRFQKALQEWVTSPHLFQKTNDSLKPPVNKTSQSGSQNFLLSEIYQRPNTLSNSSHKGRFGLDLLRPKPSPKRHLSNDAKGDEKNAASNLDEKTMQLLAEFAAKEVDERFPSRCGFKQAVENIKNSSKKRPHIIRVLEMKNVEARNRELLRLSALFPVHFANLMSNSSLSMYETMCNEASNQLCRLHPMLLIADRSERLNAAQAVVRKVEKEVQKDSRRGLLDLSVHEASPSKADDVMSKLEGVKVKQEAFKRKIAEAQTVENFVLVLEYQSDLMHLKREEQLLLEQKAKVFSTPELPSTDPTSSVHKTNGSKQTLPNEKEMSDDPTSHSEMNIMQSSALAELARAHNVFDCSADDVTIDKSFADDVTSKALDHDIKQELMDDANGHISSTNSLKTAVKRSNSASEEALPLVKKAKSNT